MSALTGCTAQKAQNNDNQNTSTQSTQEKSSVNKTNNENSNSEGKIIINEKTLDKNSTFYFGMLRDDVIAKLKELKLEVRDETEITGRQDDPQWGNKVEHTDWADFSLDKSNNQLSSIFVYKKISTSLGLKNGDSLEQMENLYGKNYNKYETNDRIVYEYTFNEHYFIVYTSADKVSEWCVSKYKFLK